MSLNIIKLILTLISLYVFWGTIMYLYINLLIFFFGITSMYLGISFTTREANNKNLFKFSVLVLALGNALCCIGYSVMAIITNIRAAFVFRDIGLLGINIYILAEIILITSCLDFSKKAEYLIIIVISMAIIADLVIWGHPNANTYYRAGGMTLFVSNDPYRHLYHSTYMIILCIFLLMLGLLWAMRAKYRRDKQFVFLAFASNFILAVTGFSNLFTPHIFSSTHIMFCLGITIAFTVFYRGASRYTTFHITINGISKDIFSTINAGLLVFDTEGKLALSNEYAKKLLGIDTHSELDRIYKIFNVDKKTAFIMREQAINDSDLDYRLTAVETGKVVLVNFACKFDKNNDPQCFILVATDLTEENRLIEEAQTANVAKSAFISNISHEIRTPINVIQGMNELILRECKDDTILKYSENINVASRNLMSLINDVLDFSKIESGKIDVVKSHYNIGSMLNDSYNMALNLAKNKHQNFDLICDPNIPSQLSGDDIRIKQILSNLLSNAIKYTEEEGTITLKVTQKPVDDSHIVLVLSVIDNGIGIKNEDQSHVFDTFQRMELEKNRTIQGTGLGLAITKNLVTLMHGTINLESTYGMGSNFTVEIPQEIIDVKPVGDISEKYTDEISKAHQVSFVAPDARILTVDDVQMNLDVFVGLLKPTKIKIDTALSGKSALELISNIKYDIIFLDHMMPEMDGIEVLHRMHELIHNPNSDTPVLMLTANAMMGADRNYLEEGFTDYLSKPIKPSALEKIVCKYLPDNMIQNIEKEPIKEVSTDFLSKINFLDTDAAMEFAADDQEFLRQILNTYITEDKRPQLEELFKKEDWPNYQIVAHALKGTSRTIGANQLSEAAKGLEFGAKEGNIEYIKLHHAEVMDEYGILLDKLKKALV